MPPKIVSPCPKTGHAGCWILRSDGNPNGIAVFEGSLEAADVRASLEEIFRFSETTA